MAVDGIGVGGGVNTAEYYTGTSKAAADSAPDSVAKKAADNGTGVIYEKSTETDNSGAALKAKNVDHESIVAKLKQDADEQTAQLRSIVEKLMLGQSKATSIAGAREGENTVPSDEDMWKFLAKGDFTVDAATKAQAQADVADDGYWGVEKTSDRILDFAKALAGNDPGKAQQLLDAFKEGYKKAEEMWGDKLPDISSRTYEAVEKKFNDWMNSGTESET